MLGVPSKTARDLPSVEGATVLEMLWVGAHTNSLRKRLQAINRPSPKKLRSEGMFDINLAMDRENQDSRNSENASLVNPGCSMLKFEDRTQGIVRTCSTLVNIAYSLRQ